MSFQAKRIILRTLAHPRVRLSTVPAASTIEKNSKLPPFHTPISAELPNHVGKYYHSLVYKGRQVSALLQST